MVTSASNAAALVPVMKVSAFPLPISSQTDAGSAEFLQINNPSIILVGVIAMVTSLFDHY